MWRIIDANLDRIGEGLRLLEDVARFLLNDNHLTEQLKTMRHELLRGDWPFHQQLIQSRDSDGDIGMDIEARGEPNQRELTITVMANARRVQESLRVLEELAKTPDITPQMDSDKFKHARFSLYSIEQTLLSKIQRRDKAEQISGLYIIIDTDILGERNPVETATQVIRGGATIIQLRDKRSNKKELLPLAQELKELCAEHNVLFIINDHLDIALAADADGLHVGQEDLPVRVARKLLPLDKILGCSVTTPAEALAAETEGADYLGVGAIYATTSKEDVSVVGLKGLRGVREAATLPLVALGGISHENVSEVIAAGADSIAVISAVLQAEDMASATGQIIERMQETK